MKLERLLIAGTISLALLSACKKEQEPVVIREDSKQGASQQQYPQEKPVPKQSSESRSQSSAAADTNQAPRSEYTLKIKSGDLGEQLRAVLISLDTGKLIKPDEEFVNYYKSDQRKTSGWMFRNQADLLLIPSGSYLKNPNRGLKLVREGSKERTIEGKGSSGRVLERSQEGEYLFIREGDVIRTSSLAQNGYEVRIAKLDSVERTCTLEIRRVK